ncbi:unnamed protein product, partial [marine sediment metagenome]
MHVLSCDNRTYCYKDSSFLQETNATLITEEKAKLL